MLRLAPREKYASAPETPCIQSMLRKRACKSWRPWAARTGIVIEYCRGAAHELSISISHL